jgi:hypothetical protein
MRRQSAVSAFPEVTERIRKLQDGLMPFTNKPISFLYSPALESRSRFLTMLERKADTGKNVNIHQPAEIELS